MLTPKNKYITLFIIHIAVIGSLVSTPRLLANQPLSSISHDVLVTGVVQGETKEGGYIVVTSNGTITETKPVLFSVPTKESPIEKRPNPIIEVIKNFGDIFLPRTGGNNSILNISFFVCLFGAALSLLSLKERSKEDNDNKELD